MLSSGTMELRPDLSRGTPKIIRILSWVSRGAERRSGAVGVAPLQAKPIDNEALIAETQKPYLAFESHSLRQLID